MKSFCAAVLVSLIVFISCGKQQKVKARIFERKQVDKNRIMIYYEYSLNNKTYRDSEIIRNFVINKDSIDLIIDPSSPGKGVPDFGK